MRICIAERKVKNISNFREQIQPNASSTIHNNKMTKENAK